MARSVSFGARIAPGSFTMDPGMRARDEFSDITSRGYNEWAKRAAERGGAKEYATSVEEEAASGRSLMIREIVMATLMALAGGAGLQRSNPVLGVSSRGELGGLQNMRYNDFSNSFGQTVGPLAGVAGGVGVGAVSDDALSQRVRAILANRYGKG